LQPSQYIPEAKHSQYLRKTFQTLAAHNLPFHQTSNKSTTTRWQRKPEYFTYSFKHFECLQLHCFCFLGVASLTSKPGLGLDFGDSGFLSKTNFNWRPKSRKPNTNSNSQQTP